MLRFPAYPRQSIVTLNHNWLSIVYDWDSLSGIQTRCHLHRCVKSCSVSVTSNLPLKPSIPIVTSWGLISHRSSYSPTFVPPIFFQTTDFTSWTFRGGGSQASQNSNWRGRRFVVFLPIPMRHFLGILSFTNSWGLRSTSTENYELRYGFGNILLTYYDKPAKRLDVLYHDLSVDEDGSRIDVLISITCSSHIFSGKTDDECLWNSGKEIPSYSV